MDRVYIEFSPESGLIFFKNSSGKKIKIHEVKVETLRIMSLSDLDYCISTNIFVELKGMHEIFREYLWSEDGKKEPRKARNEPRG